MSKKLPHGMTSNMMAIAKVEALGRQMGGHYSAGSVTDEAHTLVPKAKKKRKHLCTCSKCGVEIIIPPGGRNRKFCDQCAKSNARKSRRDQYKRKNGMAIDRTIPYTEEFDASGKRWVVVSCCKCGKITKKSKYVSNPVCNDCKLKRAREYERTRLERTKAARGVTEREGTYD